MRNDLTFRFEDAIFKRRSEAADLMTSLRMVMTYNGRAAIFTLLQSLLGKKRRAVLVPAFHCPSVVEPVLRAGFRPRFYTITDNLTVDKAHFLTQLDNDVAAAIVINYFGFPANLNDFINECRSAGVVLVEDCAHSFLESSPLRIAGHRGDAAIFSFKKLIPSLVGGGLRINDDTLGIPPALDAVPWRTYVSDCQRLLVQGLDSLEAGWLRRTYRGLLGVRRALRRPVMSGRKRSTVENRVETFDYPFDNALALARMPAYARLILQHAALDDVAARRRQNYGIAARCLHDNSTFRPIWAELPTTVCPWALPVLAFDRPNIDLALYNKGVPLFTFGETLHPQLAERSHSDLRMRDAARYLSNHLLCFSVHQQLKVEQVDKYCRIVNETTSSRDVI